MKSTLMRLREKTKTLLAPRHEFCHESLSFRRQYAAAILLQTQLSDEISPMDNFELLRLFTTALNLKKEDVKLVIRLASEKEAVLEHILVILDERKKHTIFLMDLCTMSFTGKGYGEKEEEAIDIYGDLFHFPKVELRLLKELMQAALTNNPQECMKLYANAMQVRMAFTLENLRYYIPELSYTTVLDVNAFSSGKTTIINGQAEVREPLVLPRDCTLIVQNAKLSFSAPIVMDGGRLQLIDSELCYLKGDYGHFINIKHEGDVTVKRCQFYGHNYSGALRQEGGSLTVCDSSFYESNKKSAIVFLGREFRITHSLFQNCFTGEQGAAVFASAERGEISDCSFHRCFAQTGGALHLTAPIEVNNCSFSGCHAKGFANSIYYIGVGQGRLHNLVFEHSEDERKEVIQELREEHIEALDYKIELSAYFVTPCCFGRVKPLCVHNAMLFLSGVMRLEGGGYFDHAIVKPYHFAGKDMINISNGSGFEAVDTEFDGGEEFGIFYATGTKVVLSGCMFKNTANGRAIYNSVDLLCEDTVFSNCSDGAIYGSRAVIKNSTFVNCRSDTGAGVYLVGNKGYIKNCVFDRCIAVKNGGGISYFGNYQIQQCQFSECKPDEIGR